MMHTCRYDSPLGDIIIAADNEGLTGLWFEGQRHFPPDIHPGQEESTSPEIDCAKRWLDIYFDGKNPGFTPKLHLEGTDFRLRVWEILLTVPYGHTASYGEIAYRVAGSKKKAHGLARAIGGAVGYNPVSIIVPCHRIIGSDGSITGYAGGIDKKIALLELEGIAKEKFT